MHKRHLLILQHTIVASDAILAGGLRRHSTLTAKHEVHKVFGGFPLAAVYEAVTDVELPDK